MPLSNKLTIRAVNEIRRRHLAGAYHDDLAGEFGVSRGAIYWHTRDLKRKRPIRRDRKIDPAVTPKLSSVPTWALAERFGCVPRTIQRARSKAANAIPQ